MPGDSQFVLILFIDSISEGYCFLYNTIIIFVIGLFLIPLINSYFYFHSPGIFQVANDIISKKRILSFLKFILGTFSFLLFAVSEKSLDMVVIIVILIFWNIPNASRYHQIGYQLLFQIHLSFDGSILLFLVKPHSTLVMYKPFLCLMLNICFS